MHIVIVQVPNWFLSFCLVIYIFSWNFQFTLMENHDNKHEMGCITGGHLIPPSFQALALLADGTIIWVLFFISRSFQPENNIRIKKFITFFRVLYEKLYFITFNKIKNRTVTFLYRFWQSEFIWQQKMKFFYEVH